MSTTNLRKWLLGQSVLLLLELLPTTRLLANPLVFPLFEIPNTDHFGQYPILQFGVVLISFVAAVAGILGWKKGGQIGKDAAAVVLAQQAPVAELHFDGPIRAIFEALGDIKGRQLLARLEIKDDIAVLLSGSRNTIIDKLALAQSDNRDVIEACIRDHETAVENRFRDTNQNVNSLHLRMDDIIKTLAQIQNTMPRRRS